MSDKMMKERFLVNHDMHMGPINRNLKSGDVVTWCPVNDIFTVNGNELPNDGRKKGSKEGFGTAAKALQKLAYLKPDEVTILDAVEVQGQLKPKTDTLVVFPILGCLKAACEFLGREIEWVSTTEQQTQFLELFIEHIKDVEGLDCLERKADVSVEPINEWLKEHSFNIQLDPVTDGFAVASILDVLVKTFAGTEWGASRTIVVECEDEEATINTDRVLLRRVLINLVKNALEASSKHETVRVGCERDNGKTTLYVQNPNIMPGPVKLQIFQRSFSTKGKGRGIGTYSVKMFVERYLKQKVHFISEEGKGTVFFIEFN